jgi:A/G-specific adenine glycosylase
MPARRSFAARLLAWYDAGHRDLPWRRTRDPWAIWVSEVMLQQTRVEAVREAFARFVARYGEPAVLAAASDDELHAAWRGLGYYRRARLLRDGARAVVALHGGRVPAAESALGELPGVGEYTRGAIGSIAFGLPLPAVDGNVERVVARHRGIDDDVRKAASRARVREVAEGWLDRGRPGDFNQALMELGATVCTPRAPRCGRCPVAGDCVARAAGTQQALPVRPRPRPPALVHTRVVLAPVRGGVLAFRVPAGEPNAGQLELPGPGVLRSIDAADLAAALRVRCGARIAVGSPLAEVRHSITHHRITVTAHAATARSRGALAAHAPGDPSAPWTTVARKLFARLGCTAGPGHA